MRSERGAVLVLTCIAMIALMGFTAIAVDLGQRDQQMARAQHAIDAATITAAQYLSEHPGDYVGAAFRVKEVIRQNLGIQLGDWAACVDDLHLDVLATGESTCISFRKIAATATSQAKTDIRVKLPRFEMSTVFGSVLGVDTIDLVAVAASNGNNCGAGTVCGPGTTVVDVTTPPSTDAPTTTTVEQYCKQYNELYLALDDWLWDTCKTVFPGFAREPMRKEACVNDTVTFNDQGVPTTWGFTGENDFIWYWSVCQNYLSTGAREAWFGEFCYKSSLDVIYSNWTYWDECRQRRPSLVDWDAYWTTTTSPPPASTSPPATTAPTPTVPPTTVPTSIDLSG